MSATPTISVIICAYTEQRWDDLIAAITSVQGQTSPAHDIIVVIDHNPTLQAKVQACFPEVIVVPNSEPHGLSGARNSGIRASSGEVIAFLDDDAEAAPDWLAQLNEEYSNTQVMGVGGSIEPLWLSGRPTWFPEEFHWIVGCSYRGMPTSLSPVRNLIGCNMSLRRVIFTIVGGFRTGIGRVDAVPVGCEETELCIRARQNFPGHELLYKPNARVYHRVPTSRGTWNYFRSRCYAEGLSKAQIARLIGSGDGLASERSYTFKVLPLGIIKGLGAALSGDTSGLGRVGAIVAGLALTTIGFIRGTVGQTLTKSARNSTTLGNIFK